MLNFLSKKIFGSSNDRVIKKILPLVDKVNELEKNYEKLIDEAAKEISNFVDKANLENLS